jgi:predicted GNAT superfamily acetyltransferase
MVAGGEAILMAATAENEIVIRVLTQREEFVEAVELQKTIWGFADIDLLPVRLFVVASKIGGQVFGAFDGDRMIAFLLAIPGLKPGGRSYLHGHMMGVLEGYRDRGLGRRLKLMQREAALANGVELVEWTFDPFELKNAAFNIMKLGAIVRRYVLNQYGTTSSPLHGGLPTDRLIAEWPLASSRVAKVLAGEEPERPTVVEVATLPANIAELRSEDPAAAREIQRRLSEQLIAAFLRGLAITSVRRDEKDTIYELTPWDSR